MQTSNRYKFLLLMVIITVFCVMGYGVCDLAGWAAAMGLLKQVGLVTGVAGFVAGLLYLFDSRL